MSTTTLAPATDPEAVLQRHARSFAWASQLLPRDTRRDAAALYAFCRTIDDLADDGDHQSGDQALSHIRQSLVAGERRDAVTSLVQDLGDRCGLPIEATVTLIDGVRSDLGPVEITSTGELIRYAYRVAGTVGLMMSRVLGVTDPQAEPFALDLGIAMQLTNIARDVAEDGERGRRYLPTDLLGGPVEPHRLAAPDPALRYHGYEAITVILDTADRYYASAVNGMVYIPRRARLAIMTASRLYRAIGNQIRALGPQVYWHQRAVVPTRCKTGHTLAALGVWLPPAVGNVPAHDPALHEAIAGWPGANPRAAPG